MTRRTWIARLLTTAVAAVALASAPARAGLLPVQVTVTPEAGNFRWTYSIVLPTDMKLQSGDFFTIYDFAGLVPGSTMAPDGWTSTVTNTGPTPDRINPNDSAAIPNLTWKYTGPTIPSGQLGLGNFWAVSTAGNQDDSFFVASTHRTSDGLVDKNITDTIVPRPTSGGGGGTVPEPTTLALAALGLPFVGAARLRRRKAA